jgi:hypothetical protein
MSCVPLGWCGRIRGVEGDLTVGLHVDVVADARHLIDLFELLHDWHDGDGELRVVKSTVESEHSAGCSEALIGSYGRLRGDFLRGRHTGNPVAFASTAFLLAQLCVVEPDPDDPMRCVAIGQLLQPNFARAPRESSGRRWLKDAATTAWRIAVPIQSVRQRH